jgi:hypothetical protein
LTIRAATVADATAIGEVHVRSWQAAYAGLIPADFLARLSAESRAADDGATQTETIDEGRVTLEETRFRLRLR